MLEAFPAVIVPSGANAGLSERSFASSNFAGPSSAETRVVFPLERDFDRHDLGLEDAGGDRLAGAGVASDGEIVLLRPAEVVLLGTELAAGSHVLAAVHVPQAVQDHGVKKFSVAESIAFAGLGEQVGRAAHALHAAGHDQRRVAGANRLVGEHDGFQARAADLVDRERPDGIGQAGENRRLAGWVLAQARRAITLPMITSSIDFTATPVRSRSALMLAAPSSGAGTVARAPFIAPIGVRTPATINDRSLISWFLSVEARWPTRPLDMQLLELAGVDEARGTGHQVGSLGRLGERDAIADIGQPGVEHHQAVDAQGDAAMRRCAVAEGAQKEAELFLCLFGREPEQREDLGLNDRVVAADRAAAAFLAVDHQVVRLSADRGGLGVEQMQVFEQRHGERVVLGDVAIFFGIPGEKREANDPGVMERFRVVELELGRQPAAQAGECQPGDRLGVGDDQDEVAGAWPGTARGARV